MYSMVLIVVLEHENMEELIAKNQQQGRCPFIGFEIRCVMTSLRVVSLLKTQINLHPINFHFFFRVKIYQVILELSSRWKTASLGAFQLTPVALVVKTVPKEGAVSEKH